MNRFSIRSVYKKTFSKKKSLHVLHHVFNYVCFGGKNMERVILTFEVCILLRVFNLM
jgi:hypothetical protein